jgi:hypothetical protein
MGSLFEYSPPARGRPLAARGVFQSAEVFARKWRHRLPVATPCVIIDRGGAVHLLGNAATKGPRSIAYALPS